MKIAVLHYHMNRGGVTQVVANHMRALQVAAARLDLAGLMVLHGGRAEGWSPSGEAFHAVDVLERSTPELDYDQAEGLRVDALADAIARELDEAGFAPDETVLHVHNHALGKNASLPGALRVLASRGYRLLLQIHDFVEDLRPANFRQLSTAFATEDPLQICQSLYPAAGHIHYAFLNARDRDVFLGTGVACERVHLLPNPVTASATQSSHERSHRKFCEAHGLDRSERIVLYPVRGIRRKNLGEWLLWSALFRKQAVFALTLPATSEAERPSFERWKGLASELQLPTLFNVGLNGELGFDENIAAAHRVLTTSVAEGFGLAFLEGWLHQRPLIGRNLPDITSDFSERGVCLDHLGTSVTIPLEWIGRDRFVTEMLAIQRRLCEAYGRCTPDDAESALLERVADGVVDFAILPTARQVSVVRQVASDQEAAKVILDLNPWMPESMADDALNWESLVEGNSRAVRDGFSLEATANDLSGIYGALFAEEASEEIVRVPYPERVLDAFLDVRRLYPVRVES